MPLFPGAPAARREPPDCRALRSSARPIGQSLRISVITRHTHRTFAGSAQKANTAGKDKQGPIAPFMDVTISTSP
ncbi:hypothetical protein GCM10018987_64600 [Streptomyces cremeus]